MTITIQHSERPKLIDTTAIETTQGGRKVYTFTLTCRELNSVIEPRTRQDVIQEANRRYDTKHASTIQHYLFERDNWVLGAALLAIDPDAIMFEPYTDDQGQPAPVGRLAIFMDDRNLLRLFDGQHRRGAIADVLRENFEGGLATLKMELSDLRAELQEEESDDVAATEFAILRKEDEIAELESKKERFERDSLTIMLYAEGELPSVRQMFSDAANAKPQEAITRARFDQRDAFNLAAFEIANTSQLLKGRIDMERSAVSQTSENLVSFNQLATMLKTLEFGYYGRISKTRNAELLVDYSEVVNCGMDFFDEFLPAAIEEFDLLLGQEMTSEDIPDERQISFAFNVTVLRVLAGCYYAWGTENRQALTDFLRVQRFDKGRHRNAILVQSGLVAAGANTPQARRQEVQGAIRHIIDEARKYQNSQWAT